MDGGRDREKSLKTIRLSELTRTHMAASFSKLEKQTEQAQGGGTKMESYLGCHACRNLDIHVQEARSDMKYNLEDEYDCPDVKIE